MINIKNLQKSFKNNKVLRGISLDLDRNGIIALLGPNGSGKTTFLKCILGMVLPDEGSISINGFEILGKHMYRNDIGYLSQILKFPENLKVSELIALIKNLKNKPTREQELIALFDLEPELDKKMGTLSGGNKQKVNIVLALMHDDPIIILDEPSAGLDPLSIRKLKGLLLREKQRNKLIIVTTHIMGLAEDLADDILFILDGNVHYNGSMDELLIYYGTARLEEAIAAILEQKKKQLTYEEYSQV
jgi:Cu-processing system ATP-binding protein